ncbi:hypothetical protein HanXRQr2_Chr02g0074171 [Helianthus annuus]|uniref:Uncharacterized protein n=1 Tax=Helianthus annuus TaxID=4232 RepID=A0A9K3JQ25_HELAN|nr:hypothetical protein HanXRQr2_Chr02g0074171 [Helianthus annuus]
MSFYKVLTSVTLKILFSKWNNLNPLSNNYTLKLKINSLWRKTMHGSPTETYCVDMICMDEEVNRFRLAVCIGFCQGFRTTSRPSLAPNNSTYNYTKNNQKLTFSFFSQIQKSQDWNGPKYNFNFVNFKDVVQNRIKVNTTVGMSFNSTCFKQFVIFLFVLLLFIIDTYFLFIDFTSLSSRVIHGWLHEKIYTLTVLT